MVMGLPNKVAAHVFYSCVCFPEKAVSVPSAAIQWEIKSLPLA